MLECRRVHKRQESTKHWSNAQGLRTIEGKLRTKCYSSRLENKLEMREHRISISALQVIGLAKGVQEQHPTPSDNSIQTPLAKIKH